jgi:hypothetical protein
MTKDKADLGAAAKGKYFCGGGLDRANHVDPVQQIRVYVQVGKGASYKLKPSLRANESRECTKLLKHRHTPRKRGIQYAAAFRFYHRRLWNTGSPAFAGDDNRGSSALYKSSLRAPAKQSIASRKERRNCFTPYNDVVLTRRRRSAGPSARWLVDRLRPRSRPGSPRNWVRPADSPRPRANHWL